MDKELKQKKDEEAGQVWTGISLKATKCRSCAFAYPDTEFTVGSEKGNCKIYSPPIDKPMEVMRDGADCQYYRKK